MVPTMEPDGDPCTGDQQFTTRESVERLLDLAATPLRRPHDELTNFAAERLCILPSAIVSQESERRVLQLTSAAWQGGWQPTELARQVQRATNATTARLALVVIAADHLRRRAATLHPRWIDQLDGLALPRVEATTGWLAKWAERERVPWPAVVRSVVALLRCLSSLSAIPILIPPPGTCAGPGAPMDPASRANNPMLERVRALLAQAESTTFEAEAEAFMAKAHELMTRYAIDEAMVSARANRSEAPLTIRVPIDDPYVDAKSLLLHHVAANSRCRAVFYDRFALSAVVGFSTDLAATDTLFTSLLVQAQTAMREVSATAPPGSRPRSRAFRSAFYVAYARRIGARLAEINAGVVAGADTDRSILPVLAARSSAVDAVVDEMFGELRSSVVRRGYDAAGYASGQLAADRAQLTSGDLAPGDTATEPGCALAARASSDS